MVQSPTTSCSSVIPLSGTKFALSEEAVTLTGPIVFQSVTVKPNAGVGVPGDTNWPAIGEISTMLAVTLTTKLVDVINPMSLVTVRVMVVVFQAPSDTPAGITVTVRSALLPPKTILADGTTVGSLETPVTDNAPAGVTLSPTINARSDDMVFDIKVMPWIAEIVGGDATVTVKFEVAVNPPASVTVKVIVATPLCPANGDTVAVRNAPPPPKTIFAAGIRLLLLETPVTMSDVAGVKSSPR